jgi:putative acetyltransferase
LDSTVTIEIVSTPAAVDTVKTLMREYGVMPHIAGRWDTVEDDVAALPGDYAPPSGALFLARLHGEPVGCAALHPLDAPGCAELKRMYVRPEARGHGIGLALVDAVRTEARRIGYTRLRLDTAPELHTAITLYRRLGFIEIPPYVAATLPTLYFECAL